MAEIKQSEQEVKAVKTIKNSFLSLERTAFSLGYNSLDKVPATLPARTAFKKEFWQKLAIPGLTQEQLQTMWCSNLFNAIQNADYEQSLLETSDKIFKFFGVEVEEIKTIDDLKRLLAAEEKTEGQSKIPESNLPKEKTEAKEVNIFDQEVCWSEGKGREGNLNSVLETHRSSHSELWESLKGKKVLLKLNLVDPNHPQSCTSPETLKIILEALVKQGITEVLIGDETSGIYQEAHPQDSLETIFYKLGYDKKIPPGIKYSLVDFRKLPGVSPGPSAPVIREIPEVSAVINLVKPKEHGQYYFSCGCKNLVGLVPVEERKKYFHPQSTAQQISKIYEELKAEGKVKDIGAADTKNPDALINALKEINAVVHTEIARRNDPENMKKMAQFIETIIRHFKEERKIPLINIMDGTTILRYNEHDGKEEDLNVAAISLDPVALDSETSAKLGTEGQVGYLDLIVNKHSSSHRGDEISRRPKRILRRTIDRSKMAIELDTNGVPILRPFMFSLEK